MDNDTNSEISATRNQIFILLLALIVISGTLTAYLFRQASVLGKQLDTSEKLVNRFKAGQPAVTDFVNQLGAYSMTHPDIRPVLAKYGIVSAAKQPNPGESSKK